MFNHFARHEQAFADWRWDGYPGIDELTHNGSPWVREIPAFVKPNVADGPRRKPGRPAGHKAALRRRPNQIDAKQEVALPKDGGGKPACPHCRTLR